LSLDPSPAVTLHFIVRDTGTGIALAPGTRQRIFQAPTPTDGSPGGAGLGLVIAARLVALMQGEIWVESAPGAGSAFHFTARFDAVPDQSPQPRARPMAEPAAGTVEPSPACPLV
jgi:signal transduction histidine kinase